MSLKLKTSLTSLLVATTLSLIACSDKPRENTATDTPAATESKTEVAGSAESKDITVLRLSHFWPSTAPIHTKVFEVFANKVAEDSKGRLKIEIYPSATLSKPQSTYDAAAKGTIDMGAQVQGYMNGRFPLTQIAELPGLSNSATQMSCMLQKLYDDGVISSEYDDTHLLFMIGAEPGVIHTVDKPIRTPDDMKGLRIRRPSAIAGDIIEASGGSPVGIPASDVYTSLERGVLDGLSFPWSPTGSFKLIEVVNTHTDMPFYSSAIHLTMNKDKYESLPDDLKKVLDDNSGTVMSKIVGTMFDEVGAKIKKQAVDRGDVIIEIPDPLNDPNWKGPLEAGIKKYLGDVKAKGLDADGVYAKAKEASASCKAK